MECKMKREQYRTCVWTLTVGIVVAGLPAAAQAHGPSHPHAVAPTPGDQGEVVLPEEAREPDAIDTGEDDDNKAEARPDALREDGSTEPLVEDKQADVKGRLTVKPSPLVDRILNDELTTDAERTRLQVFHGRWDKLDADNLPVAEQARLALLRFKLKDPTLAPDRDDVPALLRGEAAIWRGEPEATLGVLKGEQSVQAAYLRGRALMELGRFAEAVEAMAPIRDKFQHESVDDAAELTAAALAIGELARLEGRPSGDYHLAIQLLGKARQDADPLYWPTRVAEAKLLRAKGNNPAAAKAVQEAVQLNPAAGEAWALLGQLSAATFDFDKARKIVTHLRSHNSEHLLADQLEAFLRLRQKDPEGAAETLDKALKRYPTQRELLALRAGEAAMRFDEAGTEQAISAYQAVAPGSPDAHAFAGHMLSFARQYDWGERVLREAIDLQPNFAEPRLELGLLLMQAGKLAEAKRELAAAVRLDTFHVRAKNSLELVEDILEYPTIETENFIIRYKPGVDEVWARDVARHIEEIYDTMTGAFEHRPANKTQLDLMPDTRHFAVRITGMPDIWTIAACTGDVIAMTPPKTGPKQYGPYNWFNVMGHEYVHTVTLAQTKNRIPHWFTEACAVSMETTGRTYEQAKLLSWAFHENELFNYDNISYGFIRPTKPYHRSLAYAQAAWMLEYITLEFGHGTVVELLEQYAQGRSDAQTLRNVTGLTSKQFMKRFRKWARQEVVAWGMDKHKTSPELKMILAGEVKGVTDSKLRELLAEHPGHPDLLKLIAKRAISDIDPDAARRAVLEYALARPVDPWPHRELVKLGAADGNAFEVINSLMVLDRIDNKQSKWAAQLAKIHRDADRLFEAYDAALRALHRDPYDGTLRELAATIAMQMGDLHEARFHMEQLTLLEPDRAVHFVRLAALYARMGEHELAAEAAEKAKALDPDARVDRFLQAA